MGQSGASLAGVAGAVASVALVIGVGVWGYQVMVRDVSAVPIVQAMAGPMRVAPKDPGGNLAVHQGLAVNEVAGQGGASGPADRLVLAPREAGLGAEDVAHGSLPEQSLPRSVPSLAENAQIMELPQGAPIPEDDPIQALANQLAQGVAPLQPLEADVPPVGETIPAQTAAAPETPTTDETAATAGGTGLQRSLRPQLRPTGLKQASMTAAAQVSAAPTTRELDPTTLPAGTRLAQIGAFDSPEVARAEWARLEARFEDYLAGKDRIIQKATSGGRVFYRLRVHGFADLSESRRFCAAFVAQNVDCIPVANR
jgi:hypothetical protein